MEDVEDGVLEPLRGVIVAGLHINFEEYHTEPERLLAGNDQRGSRKHLKGTSRGLGGPRGEKRGVHTDENRTLLRDNLRIREQWERLFKTLLNKLV